MTRVELNENYRNRCRQAVDLAQDFLKLLLERPKEKNAILQEKFGVTSGYVHGYFIWHDAEAIRALLATWRRKQAQKDKAAGELMGRAKTLGDFFLKIQHNDPNDRKYGAWATPASEDNGYMGHSDMFESLPAVMELAEAVGDDRYAQSAQRCGDWMMANGYQADKGLMPWNWDAVNWKPSPPFQAPEMFASAFIPVHDEGSYLLLYKKYGDPKYLDVFRKTVDRMCDAQDLMGRWWIGGNAIKTWMGSRGIYWFGYPVSLAYRHFKDGKYLTAWIRLADDLLRKQLWDGSVSGHMTTAGASCDPGGYDAIDGTLVAMAIILWLDLYEHVNDEKYLQAALLAGDWIIRNQYLLDGPVPRPRTDIELPHNDLNYHGALFHTRLFDEKQQKWLDSPRDIATFFGIMALEKILALA